VEIGAPQADPRNQESVCRIPLDKVHAAPWQPRRHFDPAKLAELATSMRQGLLHPISVRRMTNPDGTPTGEYELIAGERRLRAARLNAALDQKESGEIEARVLDVGDLDARRMTLDENLRRDDQRAWEVAHGYRELRDRISAERGMIVGGRTLADYTGTRKWRSVVDYLRIADAVPEATLREAGYVHANSGLTDFAGVASLTKRTLLRAAQAPSRTECIARLTQRSLRSSARNRRIAAQDDMPTDMATPPNRSTLSLPTADSETVASMTAEAALEELHRIAPGVHALAHSAFGAGVAGVVLTPAGLLTLVADGDTARSADLPETRQS
jgi:ParB family chromosome partitioning protein